jgi:hypothetical protein
MERLVFISTFGADAEARLGRRINARVGIAVRLCDRRHLHDGGRGGSLFLPTFDSAGGFHTTSALCVPILSAVCGVSSSSTAQARRRSGQGSAAAQIFADYAAISIQNLLVRAARRW